jgi:hypothetical protein
MFRRFSSLNTPAYRQDGRYADRFLIIQLYHIFKAIEELNREAASWADQLTVQAYTFDAEFCNAITKLLSDSFCGMGGLFGPRDGDDEEDGETLWHMVQYLCVALTTKTNGILAVEELGPAEEGGIEDQEGGGAEKRKSSSFLRQGALLPIVGVVKKLLAVPSLGEDPLGIDCLLKALGKEGERDWEKVKQCGLQEMLEKRIELGDWINKGGHGMKKFDRVLRLRESLVWDVLQQLRHTLQFLQVCQTSADINIAMILAHDSPILWSADCGDCYRTEWRSTTP